MGGLSDFLSDHNVENFDKGGLGGHSRIVSTAAARVSELSPVSMWWVCACPGPGGYVMYQVQAGDLFVNDSLHNWLHWFTIGQI